MGPLLVLFLVGAAPVNAAGEVTGPSPTRAIVSFNFGTAEKCADAKKNAAIRWTGELDIKGILLVCQEPATPDS